MTASSQALQPEASLHVVATAGHVDHGKSALILRLTGMDPDRLAEEKRRGLTIDLGFAWTALPSGKEIGFVDVPGHERFVRNMLAGVGPVKLVLFVVAADEGWKPQSEEHLQIVDVLGAHGAVLALTKRDLVDESTLHARVGEVRDRLTGTRLEHAEIVPCSATTGAGIEDLVVALDAMVGEAPAPRRDERPRQYLDRVFTIRGAGTVVTGTLTGGPIVVGQEAEILPSGHRARIRGLQTHKRSIEVAGPVSRVAVNLAGTTKGGLGRGDILGLPGQWRPTSVFEGWIRPVRGLDHELTSRGAFKLYAGSAERDARLRLFGKNSLHPGDRAFVRITLSQPLVLDLGDGFVLREAGRQQTVAGGGVLDVDPPARPGGDAVGRLQARIGLDRPALARRIVADRGAVRMKDLATTSGVSPEAVVALGAIRVRVWLIDPDLLAGAGAALSAGLAAYHRHHPLRPGAEMAEVREFLAGHHHALSDPGLADAVLDHLAEVGTITRDGAVTRLPTHAASSEGREDADRLVAAVEGSEPTPPTVRELVAAGFGSELIKAVCADGRLVRVSQDIVVTPSLLARAEQLVRSGGRPPGLTVSGFREALGTSRKYALPILEFFDAKGLTRRQGDVRVLRSP